MFSRSREGKQRTKGRRGSGGLEIREGRARVWACILLCMLNAPSGSGGRSRRGGPADSKAQADKRNGDNCER